MAAGLYYFPRKNERMGIPLSPDTDEIAAALARQTGTRIAPSGATAANRLGLSTQVPAKAVYLTDGRTRRVRVGNMDLWSNMSLLGTFRRAAGLAPRCFRRFATLAETPLTRR